MARLTLLSHKILPDGRYWLRLRVSSMVQYVRVSRDTVREAEITAGGKWFWNDTRVLCNEQDQRTLNELRAMLVEQRAARDVRAGRDNLGGLKK